MAGKLISKQLPAADLRLSSKLDATSNAAAVLTLSKLENSRIVLSRIIWSYNNATPTGGKITVTGGETTFEFDITAGGPGSIPLIYVGTENTDVVITLAAGGSGVTGKLNANWYYDR